MSRQAHTVVQHHSKCQATDLGLVDRNVEQGVDQGAFQDGQGKGHNDVND